METPFGIKRPAGIEYSPSEGALLVFGRSRGARTPVLGLETAGDTQDGRTYVADPDANRLYGLDESGTAAVTYDMIGVSLKDLTAMTRR